MIYYRGPDGSIHYLGNPNELQHHGVLGQKWGIRRYQPYPKGHSGGKEVGKAKSSTKTERKYKSARKMQKALNKNDSKLAKARYKSAEYESRKFNVTNKMQKTKSDRAKQRYEKKISELSIKEAKQNSKIEEHRSVANNILEQANKRGYKVNQKAVKRTVNKGEVAAQIILSAPIAAAGGMGMVQWKQAPGTKYKVRNS